MTRSFKWSLVASAEGGMQLATSKTVDVEAIDVLQLTLPAASQGSSSASAYRVDLQPSEAGVVFLMITASAYSGDSGKLAYSVNGEQADEKDRVELDAAQALTGKGAISLLGGSPKTLFFYSSKTEEVVVDVICARDATPSS